MHISDNKQNIVGAFTEWKKLSFLYSSTLVASWYITAYTRVCAIVDVRKSTLSTSAGNIKEFSK